MPVSQFALVVDSQVPHFTAVLEPCIANRMCAADGVVCCRAIDKVNIALCIDKNIAVAISASGLTAGNVADSRQAVTTVVRTVVGEFAVRVVEWIAEKNVNGVVFPYCQFDAVIDAIFRQASDGIGYEAVGVDTAIGR